MPTAAAAMAANACDDEASRRFCEADIEYRLNLDATGQNGAASGDENAKSDSNVVAVVVVMLLLALVAIIMLGVIRHRLDQQRSASSKAVDAGRSTQGAVENPLYVATPNPGLRPASLALNPEAESVHSLKFKSVRRTNPINETLLRPSASGSRPCAQAIYEEPRDAPDGSPDRPPKAASSMVQLDPYAFSRRDSCL